MKLEDQLKIIRRGTVDVLSESELIEKLKEDRALNIKFGIDPTAPDIHLGHTVPLQKLRQFQSLGHNIHLIIGDYTATIGDPSGRSETRPMLTKEKIEENLATYKEQVFKILDSKKTSLFYNSEWLGKFSGTDLIKLASKYTVQQLLQRRDFSKRISENKPLSVSELIYPLLVGYDSVYLKTDIEIGGTDQLFNFMASRAIQSAHGQKPEVVITLPLLEGIDGIKKMSKSYENVIGIDDEPFDMYGKIMSISDSLMIKYFELLSDKNVSDFDSMKKAIHAGKENPMQYKQELARELVGRYHGLEEAIAAEHKFNEIHRKRILPSDAKELKISYESQNDLDIKNILRKTGEINSNKQAKRLIEQGSIRINGEKVTDINRSLDPQSVVILSIGKKYFRQVYFRKS